MQTSELIERLEAATGADRELDRAIHLIAQPAIDPATMYETPTGWRDCATNALIFKTPRYTASIDAALTLAGEGDWPNDPFTLLCSAMLLCKSGKVADLPRFICIAALRASNEGEGT